MRMREAAKNANVAEPKFELENFFRVTFQRTPLDTSSGHQVVSNDSQPIFSSGGNGGINGGNGGVNNGNDLDIVQDDVQDKNGVNVHPQKSIVRQDKIVKILRGEPEATLSILASLLNVSAKTIQRDLDELRSQRRIERIGSDSNGFWRVL